MIQVRYDRVRGCGWRKPGGKYLVGGELCHPCGKLPKELCRCPVCDGGIKPSRGFTWIGARVLFGVGECELSQGLEDMHCDFCVLREPPDRAGLIWIGGRFYGTPEAFTREAAELGISRRIAQIPKEFKVGETLVLLAHREAQFRLLEDPRPGIFAAFIPRAIEYVVTGRETADELERLEKQGCTLVRVVRRGEGDERGEGENARPVGGTAGAADLRSPSGGGCPNGGSRGGGDGSRPVREVPPATDVGSATETDPAGLSAAGGQAV